MAADMWSEPAHLLLVKALTAAGDRLAASRALNDYTELLSELGIEDDQAVAQLTRALASR
jgi:DNA-binding SARP family transcriptional activator